jgi:hypothetical protein
MSAKLAPRTLFTAASANKALPLVRAIVQDIVELYVDVREREQRLNALRPASAGKQQPDDPYSEEVEQIRTELEKDVEKLEGFVEELTEFKDPVMGLVDFPANLNGRDVYLCWKLGEPSVDFWHTHDAGFQGRLPLEETTPPAQ